MAEPIAGNNWVKVGFPDRPDQQDNEFIKYRTPDCDICGYQLPNSGNYAHKTIWGTYMFPRHSNCHHVQLAEHNEKEAATQRKIEDQERKEHERQEEKERRETERKQREADREAERKAREDEKHQKDMQRLADEYRKNAEE